MASRPGNPYYWKAIEWLKTRPFIPNETIATLSATFEVPRDVRLTTTV